jgi:hypothetical protein
MTSRFAWIVNEMIIAIGAVAALILFVSNARRPQRLDRGELDGYERKARYEGAFPFDYLTR